MPEPAMLDYFYGDEAEQYTFYRIPKVLFTDPAYRRISSDAKILYGLMLDRMGLSVRNGWLDDCQRVFIYFTLEDALEYLCCGHTKAVSLFGELDKGGLIERKKQGQGKPTKIYVKNFVRKAEVLTSKKRKSKVPQTGSQDFQKTASNNTEINNTDLNETDPSIYPVRGLPEDRPPAAADEMDTMEAYREVIKENIEYDIMRQQLGYNADLLDDILDIMVDTVCSSKRMIRIGGEDYPREVVKNRFLIAVLSFAIALPLAPAISSAAADYLVESQVEQAQLTQEREADYVSTGSDYQSKEPTVLYVDAQITPPMVLICETGVILLLGLAIGTAGITVLRKKPHEIFDELS